MKLRVSGEVTVPGDKSITHRALLLAAAARGGSRLRGLLPGEDCRSTAAVLRALGCEVPELPRDGGEVRVQGRGLDGWRAPAAPLDCGNSGTTARLTMGLLAGRPFCATLTGDGSLRRRPMRRITDPLARMGARFRERGEGEGLLPVEVCGGGLSTIEHFSPRASAQVKSAVLLAGLSAGVEVSVHEPLLSRDHTERMLRGLGVEVTTSPMQGGWCAALPARGEPLPPLDLRVPGDPSSAAFLAALALLADEGELCIADVCVNPTRTGVFRVLARMGGFVELHREREEGGEPVADLVVRPARLQGTDVGSAEIPAMIDEVPVLAVLAARAEGETRITGASELRIKESDRIAVLVENLRALGVDAEELPDGLVVRGSDRPLEGEVRTAGDHRVAMAFGILAALPGNRIRVDDPACADVSFPGYWGVLDALAGSAARAEGAAPRRPDGIVVAIDGPAGSGKSSTAKAAAAALGYRHLDSGAFYRAITLAALRAGIPPERWPSLSAAELDALDVAGVPTGRGYRMTVRGEDVSEAIRSPEVNAHVSPMAAVPAVREWLMGALREAGARGGLVADGRDIGTVVFPGAELKVFLVCATEERARRRLLEQGVADLSEGAVRAEAERLAGRDATDSGRAVAPLVQAPDAVLLDTTRLDFAEQVDAIVRLARERAGG
ncbi:MAG TPA: 3-phosphoshikimate 1-carboxyvinyltransferase [Longimicrobiaceae bacterium]|nr:3-phosphoshikimate 1-carboxyvinyltransferase [Longimicrobiaceae bacterium]